MTTFSISVFKNFRKYKSKCNFYKFLGATLYYKLLDFHVKMVKKFSSVLLEEKKIKTDYSVAF